MKRSRFKRTWFREVIVLMGVLAVSASAQQIAFTWDDLPAHSALPSDETRVEIGRKLIAAMKDAKMSPVYGFVNGVHTEEEPLSTPMLTNWRSAGLLLGNHTWSHMNLNQSALAAWEADVLKNAGCHQGQGYLFGRPLSAAAANELINSSGSTSRNLAARFI